ncbi:MAG: hypothetical protein IIZ86_04625 [Firmicutes bacterium]|nr:hypothetical protein [Bacillota bacterium]
MSKYIDRAALFNSLSGAKTVEEIFAAIQAAPAADVQEIRRGRWVVLGEQIENQTFDECKCSECGCVEYFNKCWKRFNYCPNCGAKMDEEENE